MVTDIVLYPKTNGLFRNRKYIGCFISVKVLVVLLMNTKGIMSAHAGFKEGDYVQLTRITVKVSN